MYTCTARVWGYILAKFGRLQQLRFRGLSMRWSSIWDVWQHTERSSVGFTVYWMNAACRHLQTPRTAGGGPLYMPQMSLVVISLILLWFHVLVLLYWTNWCTLWRIVSNGFVLGIWLRIYNVMTFWDDNIFQVNMYFVHTSTYEMYLSTKYLKTIQAV
jgi:hypothetical protein